MIAMDIDNTSTKDEAYRLTVANCAKQARDASRILARSTRASRDDALRKAAAAIRSAESTIIAANNADLAAIDNSGTRLTESFRDRLRLNSVRIATIAKGVEDVAELPDPLDRVLSEWTRPNGLIIRRVPQAIGVIGIIFESRPNVGADAAALCIKSGNAVILRGGSESLRTSLAIHAAMTEGLRAAGLPDAGVQMAPTADRRFVASMLGASGLIDLIIPRGGKGLVERVQRDARVPVLAHAEGLNHTYVHHMADPQMARSVVANAKMRRPGICGATETLLIDSTIAATLLPLIVADLSALGCSFRACARTREILPNLPEASDTDFHTEWLDAVLSIKIVEGPTEALDHIARHGSSHTDAIVTNDVVVAQRFLAEVDSAVTLWNTSTQFCDGGEFGFGAEIGIATGRIHARGPIGLEQLVTFRYQVLGHGQVRP